MIHLVIFVNYSTKSPRLRVLESSIHPPIRFPVLFVLQNHSLPPTCPVGLSPSSILNVAAQLHSPTSSCPGAKPLPPHGSWLQQPAQGLPKAKLSSGTVIARHHGRAHWYKLAARQGISVSPGPMLSLQPEGQLHMLRGVAAPTPQTPTPHLLGCPSCIITWRNLPHIKTQVRASIITMKSSQMPLEISRSPVPHHHQG